MHSFRIETLPNEQLAWILGRGLRALDKASTRITDGKLNVVIEEIVRIREPSGEVVPLDWWRRLAHEHQDCCSRCRCSTWIEARRTTRESSSDHS